MKQNKNRNQFQPAQQHVGDQNNFRQWVDIGLGKNLL